MVWERVSTHATVKVSRRIGVPAKWTEVEDPVIIFMSMVEELPRIFAPVTIEPFHSSCRESHDDDVVGYIDEICEFVRRQRSQLLCTRTQFKVKLLVLKSRLLARHQTTN